MKADIDDCRIEMSRSSLVDLGLCLNEDACVTYLSTIYNRLNNIIHELTGDIVLHHVIPEFDAYISELENFRQELSIQIRNILRRTMGFTMTEEQKILYRAFHNEMVMILLHNMTAAPDIRFIKSAMRWELRQHITAINTYSGTS